MLKRPDKCHKPGTYDCCIPMPIRGRVRDIDFCVADLVAALNAANIVTEASCCGHNRMAGTIILEDGRWLLVARDRDHFQRIANALADGGYPMGGEKEETP